jgi:dihydrofolate reductase
MISLIVAYAHGRVIGYAGKIPWRLPNDARYFKRVTTGHTVVMGRKTFESIGQRPLVQRRNIVLTRDTLSDLAGIEVVHSKQDVLALAEDVFIIGGEAIYREFMDVADRLYITEIALNTEGDTFFPAWNPQDFTLVFAQEGILDEKNVLPHSFAVYQRRGGTGP